jgi:D-alanine-D-alanine ligase
MKIYGPRNVKLLLSDTLFKGSILVLLLIITKKIIGNYSMVQIDKTTDTKTDTVLEIKEAKADGTIKEIENIQISLLVDKDAVKKIKKVVVAYSHVEREWFPTVEAYNAEVEVETRAEQVIELLKKMGLEVKGHKGDQYFLTNLLVDQPDVVINLVDTLKGKDRLQTSVPAALELSNINYTGAGIEGLVIGNNRNLTKRLLLGYDIPTPPFQYIRRVGTAIQEDLGLPLIVKLNESGGSVGIDNTAVKETYKEVQKKVDDMISTYKMPVIVEKFIDGPEITVVVFDDGQKRHVLMGEKVFRKKQDGKHFFTSIESYDDEKAYKYKHVKEPLKSKIEKLAIRAFYSLSHKDYAKFDIRVDEATNTPFFTDSNPNTAFGPDKGLPFTEVAALHGLSFDEVLLSLLSKYAKFIT